MTNNFQALRILSDCKCPKCESLIAMEITERGFGVPGSVDATEYRATCPNCGTFTVALYTQTVEAE